MKTETHYRREFNLTAVNKTEYSFAALADQEDRQNFWKKDAEKALKAFTDVVAEELKKDGKVQLVGFGTFKGRQQQQSSTVHRKKGRRHRNAQIIGKKLHSSEDLAASKAPKFKAGKALKDMLNA